MIDKTIKPVARKKPYRVAVTAFKALLLIVFVLFTLAYTNYTVDPAGVYRIEPAQFAEFDVVQLMREGHNVENLDNCNERLIRRDFINRMTAPVNTIVAGSSRGALITKEMVGADSMFNVSVNGGLLEDVIGFYGVLYQYDLLPERLVIVLDPWTLNDNYTNGRYAAAVGDGYYNYMTGRMGYTVSKDLLDLDPLYVKSSDVERSFWDLSWDVQWNLFSISYFQASIQRYFNSEKPQSDDASRPTVTNDDYGTLGMIRPDGSFSYPASYRGNSIEDASHLARMALPYNITGLEDYSTLDSEKKQMLIDFIRCARQDGVVVELLLEPVSNVLYDFMSSDPQHYQSFFLLKEMLYDVAKDAGIKIVGTFNPYDFQYDMACFYDGYHLRTEYLETYTLPLREKYAL